MKTAETVPLTSEQRAILLESLNEGPSIYAVQVRCQVVPFDLDVFQAAWERMVRRHAVLRMRVSWRGRPQPVQTVLPEPFTAVESAYVRGARRERTHQTALRLFNERFDRDVDLEADRLVTPFAVYSDEIGYVCWATHHLMLDGLSSRLLLADMTEEYDHLLAGVARDTPDPGSFADFVRWRIRRPAPPADATPSPDPSSAAGLVEFLSTGPAPASARRFIKRFPDGLTARMRAFARREGITAAAQFHAAWALADAELTGRNRVGLGTVGYGRPAEVPGSASILGMFTMTRLLTAELPSDTPLAEWLAEFQQEMVAAWDGRRAPGGLGGNPVVVVSHYPPVETFHGRQADVTVELLDVVDRTPHPIVATVFIGDPAVIVLNVNGVEPRADVPEQLVSRVFALLESIAGDRTPEHTVLGDLIASPRPRRDRRSKE